jgi:hypothetical protein
MKKLIAIDPGPVSSGVCLIDAETYNPIKAIKIENVMVMEILAPHIHGNTLVVIEMVAHYGTGMPAGKDVFETCIWIGRFIEQFTQKYLVVETLPRKSVKMNLCNSVRAKDSNIRQALVDRFAPGERNYGKGTKTQPGFFFGFSADAWQAYALGVTYIDMKRSKAV